MPFTAKYEIEIPHVLKNHTPAPQQGIFLGAKPPYQKIGSKALPFTAALPLL